MFQIVKILFGEKIFIAFKNCNFHSAIFQSVKWHMNLSSHAHGYSQTQTELYTKDEVCTYSLQIWSIKCIHIFSEQLFAS